MNTIISFGLCPYVQRSLITMNYKDVPYEVKYIDLFNKPDWFLKLSPLGKVPILLVGDDVLYESAVINEYIDETTPGSLLPTDPLLKAKDRATIELASVVLSNYFNAAIATDKENYVKHRADLEKNLTTLLSGFHGPFFKGSELSLVDTSFIPGLQRILLTKNMYQDLQISSQIRAKFDQWAKESMSKDFVKKSVPATFESDFDTYLVNRNSYIHLFKK